MLVFETGDGEVGDDTAVRRVLQRYIDASFSGDEAGLRAVFHPAALMAGYLDGGLDVGTPEPFYEETAANPSPQATGEVYRAEISFVHVAGRMASAGVVEENLLGYSYINHFLLLEIEGEWLIVSKTYENVERGTP